MPSAVNMMKMVMVNDDRVDKGDREAVPVMPWRRHDAEPLSPAGSMLPASTETTKYNATEPTFSMPGFNNLLLAVYTLYCLMPDTNVSLLPVVVSGSCHLKGRPRKLTWVPNLPLLGAAHIGSHLTHIKLSLHIAYMAPHSRAGKE